MLFSGFVVIALGFAFASELISPRLFAGLCVLVMVSLGLVFLALFLRARASQMPVSRNDSLSGRQKPPKTIWTFWVVIAFLAYNLVKGVLDRGGAPFWQTAIPAALSFCLISLFVGVLVVIYKRSR